MNHRHVLVALLVVLAGCSGTSTTSTAGKSGPIDAAQAKAPDMATLYTVGRTWTYVSKSGTQSQTLKMEVKDVSGGVASVEVTDEKGKHTSKLDLKKDDPFLGMNSLTATSSTPATYAVFDTGATTEAGASGAASPTPSPTPTATPKPSPSPTATPKPSPSPTPKASTTPKASASPGFGDAFATGLDTIGTGVTDAAANAAPKVLSTKQEHLKVAAGSFDCLHKAYSQSLDLFGAKITTKYDTWVTAKAGMVKMQVNIKATAPPGAKSTGPSDSTITMELKEFK
jgi:hypothetical protein